MTKSNIIDVEVKVHARTDKGIRVSTTGQQIDAEWLPLSLIEVDDKSDGMAEITLPEWLAQKNGLI